MDFTLLSSVVTVISMLCFVGIGYWAFNRNNKDRFERLAWQALDCDEDEMNGPKMAGKAGRQTTSENEHG